jgi:transposase
MSKTKETVEKTPLVERVAALAMKLGQRYLADYGARRSRHDFTQRQLMTCLILRVYLKTTYRGVLDLLAASPGLRQQMGLTDKLPHFTTLQKFSARSQVLAIAQRLVADIGQQAAQQSTGETVMAMDATGLARTTVSDYFTSRSGRKLRRWVKVAVMVVAGSMLPAALAIDLKPTHDCVQARSLLAQAQPIRADKLLADSGYDAEWIHAHCREQWGVSSVIPAVPRRADGTIGGKWRPQMTAQYLRQEGFTRRWTVESFFSALKRTMGSSLSARRPEQMLAEAALKVLAYTLRR